MKLIWKILAVVLLIGGPLLFSEFAPAPPRIDINETNLFISRGPDTVSGDIYKGYWHTQRTGAYMMTFYDASADETLYHLRWFSSIDSAVAYLDLDWTGKDTVSYQEYPAEFESLVLE